MNEEYRLFREQARKKKREERDNQLLSIIKNVYLSKEQRKYAYNLLLKRIRRGITIINQDILTSLVHEFPFLSSEQPLTPPPPLIRSQASLNLDITSLPESTDIVPGDWNRQEPLLYAPTNMAMPSSVPSTTIVREPEPVVVAREPGSVAEDDNNFNPLTASDQSIDKLTEDISICTQEISLLGEPYDDNNVDDKITIKILKNNKFSTIGECFLKQDFIDQIKSCKISKNNLDILGNIYRPAQIMELLPVYIMSIYTKPLKDNLAQNAFVSGISTKPTGRLIIRLPTFDQMYITLGSAHRVLKEKNKIWYALPLFGGKKRRIGNIAGIYGSSLNHGQIPGFNIYKLFTKEEILQGVKSVETHGDYPLSLYVYDNMKTLIEILQPESGYLKTILYFNNHIVDSLLDNVYLGNPTVNYNSIPI